MLLGCYAPDDTTAEQQAIKYVLLGGRPLVLSAMYTHLSLRCLLRSDAAQHELSLLQQQAASPEAHTSFELNSGGETWEQNVRRIATDVVCCILPFTVSLGCQPHARTTTCFSVSVLKAHWVRPQLPFIELPIGVLFFFLRLAAPEHLEVSHIARNFRGWFATAHMLQHV